MVDHGAFARTHTQPKTCKKRRWLRAGRWLGGCVGVGVRYAWYFAAVERGELRPWLEQRPFGSFMLGARACASDVTRAARVTSPTFHNNAVGADRCYAIDAHRCDAYQGLFDKSPRARLAAFYDGGNYAYSHDQNNIIIIIIITHMLRAS